MYKPRHPIIRGLVENAEMDRDNAISCNSNDLEDDEIMGIGTFDLMDKEAEAHEMGYPSYKVCMEDMRKELKQMGCLDDVEIIEYEGDDGYVEITSFGNLLERVEHYVS